MTRYSREAAKKRFRTGSEAPHNLRASIRRPRETASEASEIKDSYAHVSVTMIGDDPLFDHLADIVPIPIWMATPRGLLRYVNLAWLEATGYSRLPAGATWAEACHPHDRARAIEAFRSAVAKRENVAFDVRFQASKNAERWWSLAGVPQYGRNGRLTCYVGVCSDATAKLDAQLAARRLAGRLLTAQESERSRLARELHDDLGQRVALLGARLETAIRNVRSSASSGLKRDLTEARRYLGEIASNVHGLSHQLHPGKLKLLGLPKTLASLCRDISNEYRVEVTCTAEKHLPEIDEKAALSLFRIAQEALQNSLKHSGASAILVRVSGTLRALTLRVTDHGRGFDPRNHSLGLGLLTMQERAELAGGRLTIETGVNRGTAVEVVVPARDLDTP